MSEDKISEKQEQEKDTTAAGIQPQAESPAAAGDSLDAGAEAKSKAVRGGKKQRHVPSGIVFVEASFNNTRVTISDLHGNVISWCTGGKLGYKGSRKSTAFVAQQIGTDAARKAATFGMREVEVRIKGPGAGREAAVRGVAAAGIEVIAIKDITPVPHNGCRPPKRRRV